MLKLFIQLTILCLFYSSGCVAHLKKNSNKNDIVNEVEIFLDEMESVLNRHLLGICTDNNHLQHIFVSEKNFTSCDAHVAVKLHSSMAELALKANLISKRARANSEQCSSVFAGGLAHVLGSFARRAAQLSSANYYKDLEKTGKKDKKVSKSPKRKKEEKQKLKKGKALKTQPPRPNNLLYKYNKYDN